MALVINDTTYAGEVLDTFLARLTTGFDTANKGLIMVLPGIKKKMTIPALKVGGMIQAPKSKPTHGGSIDVDGRVLEPKEVMAYLEFDPTKFEQHWLAVQMNPALLDRELPSTAEAAITQKVLENIAQWLEYAIWQSEYDAAAIATAIASGLTDADNTYIFFDGLMKKIFVDVKTIKIATPVALTATNVFDKFRAVKDALPKGIKNDTRLKYIVSYNTAEIYADAQKAQANKGADVTSEGVMKYNGKDVMMVAGLPDNTIIATIATNDNFSNLWLGVNDTADSTTIKLDRIQNNSEEFFMKMLMKLDVNHAFGDQLVLYTTETY